MTIIWKPYAGDEDYPGLRRPVVMLEGGNKVLSRDWSEDKDVTLKRLTLSLDFLLGQGWEATWRTSEREFARVQWLVYLVQVGGIGFGYDFFLLKETAGPMCHRLTRDLCPLTDEDFVYLRQESLSLNALAKLKRIRDLSIPPDGRDSVTWLGVLCSLHYLLWIAPHPDTPPNASLEERRDLVYGSMRSHQRVMDEALLDAGWEALRSIGLLTTPAYASGPATGSSPLGPPGGKLGTILPEMMPEEGESGSPGSASRVLTTTASTRASPIATKG